MSELKDAIDETHRWKAACEKLESDKKELRNALQAWVDLENSEATGHTYHRLGKVRLLDARKALKQTA